MYSFLPNTTFTNSYGYDASGNVLNDGINSYAWNAESETKTASGVTYIYDGLGNRVEKANGTLYWHGPGGEVLDETNLTGSLTSEYVFFAGKRVARRDASGNIYYYAEDFIGSSRVITQSNGTLCSDADFLPFGQEVDYTSGCAQNYKFEGKERDIETGNDNFGARYYRSALGRWMSPDWSAIPAPVPYANLTNPATLNLYAMTSDNPETFADLDGHLGGIPEAIATNPNGFGPDMEVDSGWYEDKDGNIVFSGSAPPDPTPQQPIRTPQSPTQVQQQQANADRRAAIAATALADEGDTSMPYTPGHATCNLFVQREIAKAGAPKPEVKKADGTMGAPSAAEWAGSKIPNWRFLKPGETPQPGDVAARKENFVDATGHSGIVVAVSRSGVVTVMAAHQTVVGKDMSFARPHTGGYNNVYRRYTGD